MADSSNRDAGEEASAAWNRGPGCLPDEAPVSSVVLDTNVVLDWLLFGDPRCAPWVHSIVSGRLRWLASASMQSELQSVLARGIGGSRNLDPTAIAAAWSRWAVQVDPSDQPSPRDLCCSDGDDQKFIDLALQVRATALISRDRAVLKLARRAATYGLAIVLPVDWRP